MIIVMIRWTGLAPWELEFPFPGSLTSTFVVGGAATLGARRVLGRDLAVVEEEPELGIPNSGTRTPNPGIPGGAREWSFCGPEIVTIVTTHHCKTLELQFSLIILNLCGFS